MFILENPQIVHYLLRWRYKQRLPKLGLLKFESFVGFSNVFVDFFNLWEQTTPIDVLRTHFGELNSTSIDCLFLLADKKKQCWNLQRIQISDDLVWVSFIYTNLLINFGHFPTLWSTCWFICALVSFLSSITKIKPVFQKYIKSIQNPPKPTNYRRPSLGKLHL